MKIFFLEILHANNLTFTYSWDFKNKSTLLNYHLFQQLNYLKLIAILEYLL